MANQISAVVLFLSSCIGFLLAAPQGMNMDPNIDPFAPLPQFMPPLPPPQAPLSPPQQQNYINPPLPPPQFPPIGGSPWESGPPSANSVDLAPVPPPSWKTFSAMMNSPAAMAPRNDLNQPMPHAAASAGRSSNIPEQEFEQEGGSGGSGGMGGGQPYNPPPAFGVQPYGSYGSRSTSLLDSYYNRRPQMSYGPSYNTNNNGLFGGLFGNSAGGNLFGALWLNEVVF